MELSLGSMRVETWPAYGTSDLKTFLIRYPRHLDLIRARVYTWECDPAKQPNAPPVITVTLRPRLIATQLRGSGAIDTAATQKFEKRILTKSGTADLDQTAALLGKWVLPQQKVTIDLTKLPKPPPLDAAHRVEIYVLPQYAFHFFQELRKTAARRGILAVPVRTVVYQRVVGSCPPSESGGALSDLMWPIKAVTYLPSGPRHAVSLLSDERGDYVHVMRKNFPEVTRSFDRVMRQAATKALHP